MRLPSLAVVLNVFRRGANLPQQLSAIENQLWRPSEVLIWENGTDRADSFVKTDEFFVARSNRNAGVWPRFLFAQNAKSDFVWLIDDDVIPGHRWTLNMLETFKARNGVIGSRGLRFSSTQNYLMYSEFGSNNPSQRIEEVDIVGHNWFFPRDWLKYFLLELENRFDSELAGEDIHLSYSIQKHLGLGTFVPPHPEDISYWGEVPNELPHSGTDSNAISQSPESKKRFERAYQHYLRKGFEPMVIRSGEKRTSLESAVDFAIGKAPGIASKMAKVLGITKR